jgi:uncharacterized membrane protein YebE (DUF533 family)
MDLKKIALIGGGGVAAYYAYQWWKKQQEPTVAANGAAVEAPPPPTASAEAPAPPTVIVPPPEPVEPTEAQATDPAYWEGIARNIVAELGLGALPPWPGIGPVPPVYLGPVWSTVSPVPRRRY